MNETTRGFPAPGEEGAPESASRPGGAEGPLRLLVISYHFPPLDVIASYRAAAYARYLPEQGIAVTMLTHRWERDAAPGGSAGGSVRYAWHRADDGVVVERMPGATILRLPRVRGPLQRLIDQCLRTPGLGALTVLVAAALGFFTPEALYSHRAFKRFLRGHLRGRRYDAVLAVATPAEHIRLGGQVGRRMDIPFIADYRDTLNNNMMSPAFDPGVKEAFILRCKRFHHRRWSRGAALVVSTSELWARRMAEETGVRRMLEVRNGYDPAEALPDERLIDRERFIITYAGRVYDDQDVAPFVRSVNAFLAMLPPGDAERVAVRFFAPRSAARERELRAGVPGRNLEVWPRVPKEVMRGHLAESSVLLVMDFGKPGVYSGKFLDYIGYRRNILLVPSDHGVIAELIDRGRLGLATSAPEAAAAFLLDRFREWRTTGRAVFQGDPAVVAEASRSVQVARLAEAIKRIVRPVGHVEEDGGPRRSPEQRANEVP